MVSTPEELAEAAAVVRADLELDDVLGALGEPHLVGSAALGLMVWPDLDMTVVCDALDVAALHRAAVDLVSHPRVRQLTFRNDSGTWNSHPEKYPDGVYWGIDYRDGRGSGTSTSGSSRTPTVSQTCVMSVSSPAGSRPRRAAPSSTSSERGCNGRSTARR